MNRNIALMCVSSHLRPINADAPSGELFQRNCKRKCEREGRNRMNEGFSRENARSNARASERERKWERESQRMTLCLVRKRLSVVVDEAARIVFFSFTASASTTWRRVSSSDLAGRQSEKVKSCSIWRSGGYPRAARTNGWHVRKEKTHR